MRNMVCSFSLFPGGWKSFPQADIFFAAYGLWPVVIGMVQRFYEFGRFRLDGTGRVLLPQM
jgi:hypothetical protein